VPAAEATEQASQVGTRSGPAMAEPALNFGPQWLRDSFQGSASGLKELQQGHLPPNHPGGGGGAAPAGGRGERTSVRHHHHHPCHRDGYYDDDQQGGRGAVAAPVVKLAAMKLAEHRYGREEMLAIYDTTLAGKETEEAEDGDVEPPVGPLRRQFNHLWVPRAQRPLSATPSTEDELRAWQRGANSDTSMRLYAKDDTLGGGRGGPGAMRGRGMGRGAAGPVGRGGRGGFHDRHRSGGDDEDVGGGGGRGRGRIPYDRSVSERGGGGGWFDRGGSAHTERGGAPGMGAPMQGDDLNGGGSSPRKGFGRAPLDDWRKPAANYDGEDDGQSGWRGGRGGGRWNSGWRVRR